MPELADPRRLAAIARSDLFTGVPEPTLEPYVRIVARLLAVPTALVSIVTDEQQFFPAAVGLGEPWATRGETPLSMSFCQHVVTGDAPLVVLDAPQDERVADNLAVTELDVIAYLGVPLRSPDGSTLGALCAIDDQVRTWQDSDLEVLQDVADAVSQAIALRTSEHLWGEFASEVSHQLRTPVAAMRFELDDLATWESLDDEARGVVRAAADQAIDLSKLVDDLTDIARQRRRFGAVEVELGGVLAAAAATVGLDLAAGVDLTGGPATVISSPTALRHVLVELLRLLTRDPAHSKVRLRIDRLDGWWRVRAALSIPPVESPWVPHDLADVVRSQLGGRVASDAGTGGYELILPAG
jgi:GAF domain-containing protein